MGAPKAYVASMSRVGQRGIVGGKFWLADPNDDTAWRKKDWIVEVVDEDKHYKKGRHTFDVVFFKIVKGVDGEGDVQEFTFSYSLSDKEEVIKAKKLSAAERATLAKKAGIKTGGPSTTQAANPATSGRSKK